MTTRAQYRNGVQTFYEDTNFESVAPLSPYFFEDDFDGPGTAVPAAGSASIGYRWVKKIVGAGPPTVAVVSNAAGGQMACTLTSTSEKQDAVLYSNDVRNIDVTKLAHFEARAKLSVLPSAAGVQMVMGLAANWIDGPDNNTFYLEFGCTASGVLLVRSQDGVTQSSVATTTTLDTATFHTFRISCGTLTDIGFVVDGNRVNAANSISFAATGANAILQPYLAVYKPSGTGVATLTVDKVSAWSNR